MPSGKNSAQPYSDTNQLGEPIIQEEIVLVSNISNRYDMKQPQAQELYQAGEAYCCKRKELCGSSLLQAPEFV